MYDKLAAYEGEENYVFISYSHKDSEKVLPIMQKLCDLGCRIWYDEGIAPGSEWPENIAQHLNNCAMAIAFISPNSMASANCRREINFALSKQKPFLSVVLEPTEMPLGMELQLSAQQSVLRYNYRTEEQFINKICTCPDLVHCLAHPKQPEPQVTAVPEVPADTAEPKTLTGKPPKGSGRLPVIAGGVLVLAAILLVFLFVSPKHDRQEGSVGSTGAPAAQSQPVETEAKEITVHVKLPKGWTSPSLWAWSDPAGKEAFESWPGPSLKKDADGWYTGTVPAWVNRVSIAGGNGQYESAYTEINAQDVWIVVRNDYSCQLSYDGPFAGTILLRAQFDTWTDPHCWAWTETGDVFEMWPGEAMEKSGEWYTIELPCDTVGFKLSDQATGLETQDNILEPGWDLWFYERYGYCVWDYTEIPEAELVEIFSSVAP